MQKKHEGNEFVVYRNAQTYPEYIIRFERVVTEPPRCYLGDDWKISHISKEDLASTTKISPDRPSEALAGRGKDKV